MADFDGGCSYSSVKGDSPFRWAFLAMLTQALPGPLPSGAAFLHRTSACDALYFVFNAAICNRGSILII